MNGEDVTFFQSLILALVQGGTEFLPISSSAHLILVSEVMGWADQGLVFDVAVHLGTLLRCLCIFVMISRSCLRIGSRVWRGRGPPSQGNWPGYYSMPRCQRVSGAWWQKG